MEALKGSSYSRLRSSFAGVILGWILDGWGLYFGGYILGHRKKRLIFGSYVRTGKPARTHEFCSTNADTESKNPK